MPKQAKRKSLSGLNSTDQPLALHVYDFARKYFFADRAVYFPGRFPSADASTVADFVRAISSFTEQEQTDPRLTSLLAAIQQFPEIYHEFTHRKSKVNIHTKLQGLLPYCKTLWKGLVEIKQVPWKDVIVDPEHRGGLTLGVFALQTLAETDHFTSLEGVIVPISRTLNKYMQRNNLLFSIVAMFRYKNTRKSPRVDPDDAAATQRALTKTLGNQKGEDLYVVVGPLSFANGGCDAHSQIVAARVKVTAHSAVQYGGWQKSSLCKDVDRGEELLLAYGDNYPVQCPKCGNANGDRP